MFDGEIQDVELLCDNDMMKCIIDRFGKTVVVEKTSDYRNKFIAKVKISVSPTFFGWLFGFAGKIKLISPAKVVDKYRTLAQSVIKDNKI